jgi:hypothetical protein
MATLISSETLEREFLKKVFANEVVAAEMVRALAELPLEDRGRIIRRLSTTMNVHGSFWTERIRNFK